MNGLLYRISFVALLITLSSVAFSANDSIVFINGDFIVGEIKGMTRGVLEVETDYSDSDFEIEWEGVAEIYGVNFFLVSLTDGTRFTGSFSSVPDGSVLLKDEQMIYETQLSDIVYIKSVDQDFWSRIYASIDLGLSLTKANNLQQLNTRSNVGYIAELWSVSSSLSTLFSKQDDVDATRRTDGSGTFSYFLPKDWYIPASISFLSNTEQKLNLRFSSRIGFGKYLINTNQKYLGFSVGASYSNEKYSTETDNRKSLEAYVGGGLNLYDIGDLNLLLSADVYQGLTDTDRFRADLKFDTKYDLPLDFYIKVGFTLNYDNTPAEGAGETDYLLESGFGWEL